MGGGKDTLVGASGKEMCWLRLESETTNEHASPPRFVQYKATSLEKQHKHDLLTEPDLGVTIDLINPDTYRIDPNGVWETREGLSLASRGQAWTPWSFGPLLSSAPGSG
jgi:hypothetical protein